VLSLHFLLPPAIDAPSSGSAKTRLFALLIPGLAAGAIGFSGSSKATSTTAFDHFSMAQWNMCSSHNETSWCLGSGFDGHYGLIGTIFREAAL
jgi:hypothetical protein